ncbi:hypothetical protein OTU49_004901 [Cherax quadricarinatus]|uniref:Uncharacterized protein n=1 Tax=Cherax quadricarinatus TaxID=27406 RepID=A0AAW0WVD3_CHEQU
MNLTTVLWTLLLVVLTVLKIVVTIIVTTIKTILVKNDWLWTQGWNMVASFGQRVVGLVVEGANLGLGNMMATLLHDLTAFVSGVFGLVVTILSKLMTVTFWTVKYLVNRCKDMPHTHFKNNVTEEKTLTIHDLS